MAYKKYLTINGKKYGPYYYQSYRDKDGKVKKRYVKEEEFFKANKKKIFTPTLLRSLFFVFIGLLVVFSFILVLNSNITGFVVSEESSVEVFDGSNVGLEVKEPAKKLGKVVSENKNKRMEFDMNGNKLRLYFDVLNYSEYVEKVALEVELDEGVSSSEEVVVDSEVIVNDAEVDEVEINNSQEEVVGGEVEVVNESVNDSQEVVVDEGDQK